MVSFYIQENKTSSATLRMWLIVMVTKQLSNNFKQKFYDTLGIRSDNWDHVVITVDDSMTVSFRARCTSYGISKPCNDIHLMIYLLLLFPGLFDIATC